MSNDITPEIEASEAALTEFASETFPAFHSITDTGEYDFDGSVERWFAVLQLMDGLKIPINPKYQYQPGAYEAGWERQDYEAAHKIVTSGRQWWDETDAAQWPTLCTQYGSAATKNALTILGNSSQISELIKDYFTLEQQSTASAEAKITGYAELLTAVNEAYKAAGWERG